MARTCIVPSYVLAMSTWFRESVTSPFTFLAFSVDLIRLTTSGGHGPTLNSLRFMPDCMFHMRITPDEDDANPKFPQAVTQAA